MTLLEQIEQLEGDKKTLQLSTEAIRQKMIKQIEEIKELKEYARHKNNCQYLIMPYKGKRLDCTCGFDKLNKH